MSSCSASPQVYGTPSSRACQPVGCCPKKKTFQQTAKCCPNEPPVPPVSDEWTEYVPVITDSAGVASPATTTTVLKGWYLIRNNTMQLQFQFNQPNNTGAVIGSGPYEISIPIGYTAVIRELDEQVIGAAMMMQPDGTYYTGSAMLTSARTVVLLIGSAGVAPNFWGSAQLPLNTAGVTQAQFNGSFELDV